MSVRVALKLLVVSLLVFAVAFTVRRTFLGNVMPVSWDQEPQSLWALGLAFLLRSIENLAAVVAAMALAVAIVLRLGNGRSMEPPKLRGSE